MSSFSLLRGLKQQSPLPCSLCWARREWGQRKDEVGVTPGRVFGQQQGGGLHVRRHERHCPSLSPASPVLVGTALLLGEGSGKVLGAWGEEKVLSHA